MQSLGAHYLPRHLRLGGRCCAVAGKRAAEDGVDGRAYSQQLSLIGVIHVSAEWLKPIHSQGESRRNAEDFYKRDPGNISPRRTKIMIDSRPS
ncbi:hypothetical protein LDENG_00277160 [Lucifuga dentata]|nr:hypothetical protein LDENG_00277160 [Lucifuga dentata]